MGITAIMGVVSGVLSSIKNARDLAKDSEDLDLKGKLNEVYDRALDMKETISGIIEENRSLNEQLQRKQAIDGPIPPYGYYFQKDDRKHPLCPRCY